MEGYLSIWSGFLLRWKQSFFILHDDILTYCSDKGGEKQGAVHLKVASIVPVIDDPLKIHLHTGSNVIYLRAANINEKLKWIKALNLAQNQNYIGVESATKIDYQVNKQQNKKKIELLESITVQIWNSQAELEEIINHILYKFKQSTTASRLCQKLSRITSNIKHKSIEALKIIQQQKNLLKNSTQFKLMKNPLQEEDYKSVNNQQNKYDQSGQYKSFYQNKNPQQSMDGYYSFEASKALTKKPNNSYAEFHSFINDHDENYQNRTENNQSLHINNINLDYKKSLLLKNKKIFQYLEANPQKSRQHLPQQCINTKINLLSVLKNFIGQDIAKANIPVVFHQPLSTLQKNCQQMYYSCLLDKANKQSVATSKLLYVMAFVVSQYSLTNQRTKKTFNPLLSETFEFIDQKRNFRYISEQVQDNPPISAFHCQSHSYQYIGNTRGQSIFRGSLKHIPQSLNTIILKNKKQKILFNKCISTLNNLLVGSLYVDNYGQINFKMQNEKQHILATGYLQFKECSMWGNNQYQVVGWIKDQFNIETTHIEGRWNQQLFATFKHPQTNKISIWKATHQNYVKNYNFNDYTIILNHMNLELADKIAPTDSRFRPDQRALEFNLIEQAQKEKNRLEISRKFRKKQNEKIEPVWFNSVYNKQTKQIQYISNKKYWKCRKEKDWSKCPLIF